MKFIKKLQSTALLLILAIAASAPHTVYAESSVNVTIDGQQVDFPDHGPVIVDGRLLVPVRGVFEALGFDVSWDQNTQQVTLTGSTVVVLTIGSSTFTIDDTNYTLIVPAQIIDGRTKLPIRAVLESTGFQVDWVEDSRTVRIITPDGYTREYSDDRIAVHNAISPLYFTERNAAVSDDETQPSLVIYADGNFTMVVNLYAGMGIVQGTACHDDESITFNVSHRNFKGFLGDDVYEFTMQRVGNNLLYLEGMAIGMTRVGAEFHHIESVPLSLVTFHYNSDV